MQENNISRTYDKLDMMLVNFNSASFKCCDKRQAVTDNHSRLKETKFVVVVVAQNYYYSYRRLP